MEFEDLLRKILQKEDKMPGFAKDVRDTAVEIGEYLKSTKIKSGLYSPSAKAGVTMKSSNGHPFATAVFFVALAPKDDEISGHLSALQADMFLDHYMVLATKNEEERDAQRI